MVATGSCRSLDLVCGFWSQEVGYPSCSHHEAIRDSLSISSRIESRAGFRNLCMRISIQVLAFLLQDGLFGLLCFRCGRPWYCVKNMGIIYICVYMYVCMYVCMYVYMCMYIYIYTYRKREVYVQYNIQSKWYMRIVNTYNIYIYMHTYIHNA